MKPHYRICLAAFLLDGSVMVGFVSIPFFVFNQIGGGAAMSGAFGAAMAATYALTCLVSSRFVARTENGLNWAASGVVAFLVLFCLMPLFRNPYVCGGLASLASASLAFSWPALHSWVGGEPDPRARRRNMGLFNIAWSSGFAVAPLIGGPLYDWDYRLPFVLVAALGAMALVLIRTLPHEGDHFADATEEDLEARAGHDYASEVFLYCAWCATFTANVLAGVTRSIYSKRVDDLVASGQLRLLFEETPSSLLASAAATKFSWLVFAWAAATTLVFFAMGRTSWWRHKFAVLAAVQAAAAYAFWVLGHTQSLVVMMGCFAVVGANLGLAFFSSTYYSLANPDRKHGRAAVNEGVVGLGNFAGNVVFALIARQYAVSTSFHYTPVFVLCALLAQAALLRYGGAKTRGST